MSFLSVPKTEAFCRDEAVRISKLSQFTLDSSLARTLLLFSCRLLAVFFRRVCVCVYLLDVLLEHTQLQSLVQSDLSVLPNILETPLVVENLVHHVQDAVDL